MAVFSSAAARLRDLPDVLLLATLLRLALNVASTRVVLLQRPHRPRAAARHRVLRRVRHRRQLRRRHHRVRILTIINFVVVTKGAGRISEVSARFTLDAMPGKQMAIDADLNAGLITQDEARGAPRRGARRGRLLRLHGRRQQVRARRRHAGILILFINIIGGLAIGTMQHDLAFGDAAQSTRC
jgi:flagellar biosynthesis protein FlhA